MPASSSSRCSGPFLAAPACRERAALLRQVSRNRFHGSGIGRCGRSATAETGLHTIHDVAARSFGIHRLPPRVAARHGQPEVSPLGQANISDSPQSPPSCPLNRTLPSLPSAKTLLKVPLKRALRCRRRGRRTQDGKDFTSSPNFATRSSTKLTCALAPPSRSAVSWSHHAGEDETWGSAMVAGLMACSTMYRTPDADVKQPRRYLLSWTRLRRSATRARSSS
jgi:hypothetical protein